MSYPTQMIECTIRSTIEDWFKTLIIQKFGADVTLRYLTYNEHFNTHTDVEIIVKDNQIKEVFQFIGNISEELQYKLPWLNGNMYYVVLYEDCVKRQLKKIIKETEFDTTLYFTIGCPLTLFIFPPDLDDIAKIKIDKIFKTVHKLSSIFLTYPKTRAIRIHSSFRMATTILIGYHGKFLQHLNLEDILSLEIANNSLGLARDEYLHHDIQQFLRYNYPELYESAKQKYKDLKDFKINEVLSYFISKYHDRFEMFYISNILTAVEIQSLSQSYNTIITCNDLVHIDFEAANGIESGVFCGIYHYDPNPIYFLNYDSTYARENSALKFNADDTLDSLQYTTDFSYFVIKSPNNCLPQKTNSVLKFVTEHFRASQNNLPSLILYGFDLNYVPREILNSLLKMMCAGWLQFYKMQFNLKTLIGILEQSNENLIPFFKCHFDIENGEVIPINSKKSKLELYGMDIDLNLLCSLNNYKYLIVKNCQILSRNRYVPMHIKTCDYISFQYTTFDMTTFIRLLKGLQDAKFISFWSCDFTFDNNLLERTHFILRNCVQFKYMVFEFQTLFQIFENCEVQNRLWFGNCHFRLENDATYRFRPKPVNIHFNNMTFDLPTLLTFLGLLNKESKVWLESSIVLPLVDSFTSTNTLSSTILTSLSKIKIHFINMTIESLIVRPILQTNSEITFNNCCLPFMTDEFLDISVQSTVILYNMIFTSVSQLNWLANFTPESQIRFINCRFEFASLEISNIVIKPLQVEFNKITLNCEILLNILEKISEHTVVLIEECLIRAINPLLFTRPIKIKILHFSDMNLQIQTILSILKDFTDLENLYFKNCRIVCSNPNGLPNIRMTPSILHFIEMDMDVHILKTLMLKCTKRVTITLDNCMIKTSRDANDILLVKIEQVIFKNINYSPEMLQFLKCLNDRCSVRYLNRLSNQAIIEICTKTPIYGNRLLLDGQICTKLLYFELFAEFFRSKALHFEFDPNVEYDLPPYPELPVIRPHINIKVKFVVLNDGTVKIEFLKNGIAIDLFFELNDLPDDSVEYAL